MGYKIYKINNLSFKAQKYVFFLFIIVFSIGIVEALVLSPADYKQSDSVRIMYVHVPSAWTSVGIFSVIAILSLGNLIFQNKYFLTIAKSLAPSGLIFNVIALVTGSIWGRPTWGTWWAWDPRLTSFLVLFLFYLGYIALWSAIDNPDTAADLTSMLCIVGSVFAILSRYAVNFWNQGLHQGASLSLDKEKNVADVFYQPLLFSIFGFVFLFLTLVLIGTRTEIRLRRTEALRLRKDSE